MYSEHYKTFPILMCVASHTNDQDCARWKLSFQKIKFDLFHKIYAGGWKIHEPNRLFQFYLVRIPREPGSEGVSHRNHLGKLEGILYHCQQIPILLIDFSTPLFSIFLYFIFYFLFFYFLFSNYDMPSQLHFLQLYFLFF